MDKYSVRHDQFSSKQYHGRFQAVGGGVVYQICGSMAGLCAVIGKAVQHFVKTRSKSLVLIMEGASVVNQNGDWSRRANQNVGFVDFTDMHSRA